MKSVPEESVEGEGNMRAAAVEAFCSMLAEIRAYGEGMLMAEQIPTKLARDVLKNTSLKIMHRLVAKDDRDMLGDTMNLSQPQKRHAVALERGRAALFGEGMDEACLIDIPSPPGQMREINAASLCSRMRVLLYHGVDNGLLHALALCFLSQKVAAVELAPTVQERVVRNVMAALDVI